MNLGWKLAQVVKGTSPDGLLDTYQAERHPIAARVLHTTMASVALRRDDERTKAARETVGELLAMDEPRRRFGAEMSGLGIRYDLGEGHPLLGRRMPDLDLVTADGPLRVFTLLHEARPVFINLGEPRAVDISPWADRVPSVEASYTGTWELPAIGDRAGSDGGPRSARRVRGVGGRGESGGTGRRTHTLVRPAGRGLGSGPYAGISPLDAFRAPSSRAVMTPPPMIATIPAT